MWIMNVGPVSRGEIRASEMTIREKVLLEIYSAMLAKGGLGVKQTLDKSEEATAYYLRAIDKIDLDTGRTHE
jgi:hypothetical protein